MSYRDIEELIVGRGVEVDQHGQRIDFLLKAKRSTNAAYRFFTKVKVFENNSIPTLINIDKSGANLAGLQVDQKTSQSYA